MCLLCIIQVNTTGSHGEHFPQLNFMITVTSFTKEKRNHLLKLILEVTVEAK